MQLTVLGCRAGMPADGQPSSGYLVQDGSTTLLLDCGPGVATALSAVTAPDTLTAVVISQLDADRCYDLLPLGRSRSNLDGIPLYVPEGGRALLDRLAALFPVPTGSGPDRAFDVREYRPGQRVDLPGCRVDLYPGRGVRVHTDSATLAHAGDTGDTGDTDALAHDVDVLLAEATEDATAAGLLAARNGVRELILTRFPSADPDLLDARRRSAAEVYGGLIRLAAPGRRFPVLSRVVKR